jgi:hypothetical protein
MIPTMVFSKVLMRLNLIAGPHEEDHEAEKAHGSEDVQDIGHISVFIF